MLLVVKRGLEAYVHEINGLSDKFKLETGASEPEHLSNLRG